MKSGLLDSCPRVALVPEGKGTGPLNFGTWPTEPFPFVDHEAAHPDNSCAFDILLLDFTVGPLVGDLVPAAGDEVQGGAVLPLTVDRADLRPSDHLSLYSADESQCNR